MGGVHRLTIAAGTAPPGPHGAEPIPTDVRLARDPLGVFHVPRRDDIEGLLLDRRLSGVGLSFFDAMGIGDGPLRRWYAHLMFTTEGEEHHRLRSLVQRAFTPKAVEGLRGFAAVEARSLLAPVAATGSGDLVDMAFQLPIRAMARLLGVPTVDIDRFTAASADLARVFGFMTPEQVAAATDALEFLQSYVASLLEARRADPGPDLITALLAAEDDGDRLTHDECTSMVINLLVGGHDTTTSQIACTLWLLLAEPERLAAVAAYPTAASAAVEETIRLRPGLGVVPRVAMEDVAVGDDTIPAGSIVLLLTADANRDGATYERPDAFDAQRFAGGAAKEGKVLSFGAGLHYCLGAAMARMLVTEAVLATAALPPVVELTEPPDALPWTRVLGEYPARLPVRCGRA